MACSKVLFSIVVIDFGASFFKITSLVSSSLPVYLPSVPHCCLHICIPRSSRFLQFSNRLKQPLRFSTNFSCNQKFFKSNWSLNLLTAVRSNSQCRNCFSKMRTWEVQKNLRGRNWKRIWSRPKFAKYEVLCQNICASNWKFICTRIQYVKGFCFHSSQIPETRLKYFAASIFNNTKLRSLRLTTC